MAIENIVNANAEILGLLLPQYQLVNADAETGTLSFDANGQLIMLNACNRSQKAVELTRHVLASRGIERGSSNKEILVGNLEVLTSFREQIDGLSADVVDSIMNGITSGLVLDEDVAVATIE